MKNTDDAEDEEDKEAEKEDVAEHGESVQQQHHQDPHACPGFILVLKLLKICI